MLCAQRPTHCRTGAAARSRNLPSRLRARDVCRRRWPRANRAVDGRARATRAPSRRMAADGSARPRAGRALPAHRRSRRSRRGRPPARPRARDGAVAGRAGACPRPRCRWRCTISTAPSEALARFDASAVPARAPTSRPRRDRSAARSPSSAGGWPTRAQAVRRGDDLGEPAAPREPRRQDRRCRRGRRRLVEALLRRPRLAPAGARHAGAPARLARARRRATGRCSGQLGRARPSGCFPATG